MGEIDKLYPDALFRIDYEDWANRYNVCWQSKWLADPPHEVYYEGVLIFRDEYAYFTLWEVPQGRVFYNDPVFLETVLAWMARSFNV